MRFPLATLSTIALLVGASPVLAASATLPSPGVPKARIHEGRAASEGGSAMHGSGHSIENANPNRADMPPRAEAKGP